MTLNAAEQVEFDAIAHQKPMNEVIDRGDSTVQQFYRDAVVFVTGGTGFLGKQLIEKLLRACQLKKVYVLLRTKKGKPIQERLEIMLKDPVFDLVRVKQPLFADKIVAVEGDVADLRLGLSQKDWTELIEEVDTIFHVAATVRFDEPLLKATLTNVRGTREVLTLAKNCYKLKNFIHVSTAFCHATYERVGKEVLEKFYKCPIPPDAMIELAEETDEGKLIDITPELIKGWSNTYTFTKAIAEELVRKTAGILPICVVRPAAVICSYYEPSPGWLDTSCLYATGGFVLGVGLGVVRVALVDKHSKLNLIPVDIVNNAIIVAPWDCSQRRQNGDLDIPIYTVTNEKTSITFEFISNIMRNNCIQFSSPKAMWYCFLVEIKNKMAYKMVSFFLHYIPAYVIDAVCAVFGIKIPGAPSFVKIYEKYDKLIAVNNYFLSCEFKFKDYNLQALINKLSDADKAIFNCDLYTVDFKELVKVWCLGIRKYALKDGFKDVAKGYKKQKLLRIVHYVVMALYLYLLWSILCISFSVVKYMFGM